MSQHTNCQYKVLERVYYVNLDELVKKIKTGNVLRHDSVKIGESDWTAAEKIPELAEIFQELDLKNTLPEGTDFQNIFTHFQAAETDYQAMGKIETLLEKACAIHPDKPPYYTCTICENLFCRDCPAQDDEQNRICAFCGGQCNLYMGRLWKLEDKKTKAKYEVEEKEAVPQALIYQDVYTKLTFRDFVDALKYPLRFPIAILVCGILFSALVLGQIVTVFKGGGWIFAAAAITAVIVMLKFGILSKCFENLVEKDRQRQSFMPHIKKFGFLEDFIIPLLTGFHSYLVAFGLFIVLAVGAVFYAWFSFAGDLAKTENEVLQAEQQVNSVLNTGKPDATQATVLRREKQIKTMLEDLRMRRLEYVFGTNHLADSKQLERLIRSVMSLTLWLQMPLCFAFIFGVLFFPAVCLATGETHSLSMRKNFISGFKMMKTIGFDYLIILFMCFVLLLFSVLNVYALNWIFSKLELPAAGVFSTIIGGSFLVFYFWVVFSSILSTVRLNKETLLLSETPN